MKDSQTVRNLHDAVGDDRYAFGVETVHPNPHENRQTFVAEGRRKMPPYMVGKISSLC